MRENRSGGRGQWIVMMMMMMMFLLCTAFAGGGLMRTCAKHKGATGQKREPETNN
jgi:hypothetical protein